MSAFLEGESATLPSDRQWVTDLLTELTESLAEKLNPLSIKPVLVDIRGVTAMTGKSRADVYRSMAANNFPHPVDDGTGASRWRVKDIKLWASKLRTR